jgi:hypothetical protein
MSTFAEPWEDSISIMNLRRNLKPDCIGILREQAKKSETFVIVRVLLAVVREEICTKAELNVRLMRASVGGEASGSCQKGSEGNVVVGYQTQPISTILGD